MSLELKRFLLNSYRSFVSRDVGRNEDDTYFRIDDAKQSDKGSMCCHICVRVTGLDRFRLDLNNLPSNHQIEEVVKSKGGEIRAADSRCHISLALNTSDSDSILTLAGLIRGVVGPRQRRSDPNHVRIWSRTADSLDRFASLMRQYEKQTSGMEKTRPDGLFAF